MSFILAGWGGGLRHVGGGIKPRLACASVASDGSLAGAYAGNDPPVDDRWLHNYLHN